MRRYLVLKAMSVFGGALSVWMELHFFYTIFSVFEIRMRGGTITRLDTMLLPMDVFLFIMGLLLHCLIEDYYVIFLQRGSEAHEAKALNERRG